MNVVELSTRAPQGVPAHDLEAEQAVLGAVLISGAALAGITADGLRPDDFYRSRHRLTYGAMLALRDRDAPVDVLTVANELRERGHLDDVGGKATLDALAAQVPAAGNVRHYARIVRSCANARAVSLAGARLSETPNDPAARQAVSALISESADGRLADRRYDFAELERLAANGVPWRVPDLLADGHLTLLAGKGGDGKTLFEMALAGGVARGSTVAGLDCAQGSVVIFDAENGGFVLGDRLRRLDPSLPADRVHIYDAAGLSLADPADRDWMARIIGKHEARFAAWDSLRALTPGVAENESDEMAPAVIGLRQLCRDTGVAGLVLHHRDKEGARDFRGSGTIQDQVDLLFVLERDDKDPERKTRRRVRCAKCRIAPEPEDRWLSIKAWRGQLTLMEAAAPSDQRATPARDQVAADALEAVRRLGPVKRPTVAIELGRRKDDKTVDRALKRLYEEDAIRRTDDGYVVVTEADDHPPHTTAPDTAPAQELPVVTTAPDHPDHPTTATGGQAGPALKGPPHDHPDQPNPTEDRA